MPIYEFRCQDCGQTSSVFRRTISSDVETNCPSCGGSNLARLISTFALLKADMAADSALSEYDMQGADGGGYPGMGGGLGDFDSGGFDDL